MTKCIKIDDYICPLYDNPNNECMYDLKKKCIFLKWKDKINNL